MAKCAREIIQQNGFGNKIRLIPKRSTDITVGRGNIISFYDTCICSILKNKFSCKYINSNVLFFYINMHYYDIHLIEWSTIELKMLTNINFKWKGLNFRWRYARESKYLGNRSLWYWAHWRRSDQYIYSRSQGTIAGDRKL